MNPFIAYEAIETKIAARKAQILDEQRFKQMLECSTVEQVTELIIKGYNFKHDVEDLKRRQLHRDDLETLFNRHKVSELEDILHFCSGPYKEFLQTFLIEFEIYDLVLMLRKISKGESLEGIENHFIHSVSFSSLPYEKLAISKTVVQFIEKLKGTPYYSVLKTTTDDDVAKREFHVETKLQLLLYNTLFDKAAKLAAADRKAAEELMGLKIDCLNAQWVYRAQKYYRISPEQMLIYSLRGGRKLSFERLKTMCYSKSMSDLQKLSNQYLRSDIFKTDNNLDIEKNLDRYMYSHISNKKFKGTIGTVISYLYLLDIIIKEFIIATEAIRYKVPKELMGDYLIRLMGKEEVKQ